MDIYDRFSAAVHWERRRQRRRGAALTIIGVLFVVAGVLLIVFANPWLGAICVAFGAIGIVVGIVDAKEVTPTARRWSMIIGSALFGLVGALMIVANTIEPESFGRRSGPSITIIGAITLVFFGGGSILLLVRQLRRGRSNSS